MEYVQLGSAGVRVSRLCLGGLNFGGVTDEAESVAVVRAALNAGINFISTSNIYNDGESERILGAALKGHRDDVVLATMGGLRVGPGTNDHGNSRRHLLAQAEESLRRLGTDWIDLYQLHRPDPATSIEETLLALDDLVQAGKIRYVGLSTFPAWQVMRAIAAARRVAPRATPVTEQLPYHLLDRSAERELIPLACKYGMAVLLWSPVAAGLLTGKYRSGKAPEGTRFALSGVRDRAKLPAFGKAVQVVGRLQDLAATAGLTPLQLAMGWLLQQPDVTAPVIGPRNCEQLAGYVDTLGTPVGNDLAAAINAICPPGETVYRL